MLKSINYHAVSTVINQGLASQLDQENSFSCDKHAFGRVHSGCGGGGAYLCIEWDNAYVFVMA